jgi:hypothetical protein
VRREKYFSLFPSDFSLLTSVRLGAFEAYGVPVIWT